MYPAWSMKTSACNLGHQFLQDLTHNLNKNRVPNRVPNRVQNYVPNCVRNCVPNLVPNLAQILSQMLSQMLPQMLSQILSQKSFAAAAALMTKNLGKPRQNIGQHLGQNRGKPRQNFGQSSNIISDKARFPLSKLTLSEMLSQILPTFAQFLSQILPTFVRILSQICPNRETKESKSAKFNPEKMRISFPKFRNS